jgi:murein L,D-transpeptidase YcbB/YkuD
MMRRRRFLGLVFGSWLAVLAAATLAGSSSTGRAAEPVGESEAAAVLRHLAAGGEMPAWAKSAGIRAALDAEAEAQGLAESEQAASAAGLAPEQQTLAAALWLARMLTCGAVAPPSVQPDWAMPRPRFSPQAALRILVSLDDPLPWLRGLAPRGDDYRRLQQALLKYRTIVQRGGWPAIPAGPALKMGSAEERAAMLKARLEIEGDLAPGISGGQVFDAATAQALRHFQARHGLAVDGQLGHDTLVAMNINAEQRYRQIAANMERWRWLPRRLPPDRVMVNAAAAQLALFEEDRLLLELRTVVGLRRHPTPSFTATIGSLLLNPPWDIPASIAAHEIRPLVRRDPGYLEREGIIAVAGSTRLRQLPGPRNPLGEIKFEMPNLLDVYLHDTPAKELLKRPHRFFSHGCIRVENPRELALRLLPHDAGWTRETLDQAVATGATSRVPIDPPVPVYVLYFTVIGGPEDGVTFLDDAYGRDLPLIEALFPEVPRLSVQEQATAEAGCRC